MRYHKTIKKNTFLNNESKAFSMRVLLHYDYLSRIIITGIEEYPFFIQKFRLKINRNANV